MAENFLFKELITAMVTPFNPNKKVDFLRLEKLVNHLVTTGSDSILVAGTTGESPTLTEKEKLEVLSCVQSNVPKTVKVIFGIGGNNTEEICEKVKKTIKVDGILSVVPYYNKPSQPGLKEHFSKIASQTDLPIILYNIPSRTGINMLPETVGYLADKHKNIIALKQSFPDFDLLSEIRKNCPENFSLYSGDDSLTLPMLSLGAVGVVSVASHIQGYKIKNMISLFKEGKIAEAQKLHLDLYPLFKKLFMAPNPVPVKACLAKMKIINEEVRLPLVPLNSQEKKQLFDTLNPYLD